MTTFKKLDAYLEEIDHYLVVDKGGEEILSEIRSHILEKAAHESGELTEEAVEKIIAGYGSPRQVAEKYLEGHHIIAPSFKKYLLFYTGILFTVHAALTILSYVLGIRLHILPFFIITRLSNIFELLAVLPNTLVYDIGLVGIILYFVTQEKREVRLPWPKFFRKEREPKEPKKMEIKPPSVITLLVLLLVFGALVVVFFQFGTIFFLTFNLEDFKPLFQQPAAFIYSLMVLGFFSLEIITYIIRFINNSLIYWLELGKNCIYLLALWIIVNNPVKNALADSLDIDIDVPGLGTGFIWGVTFVIVLDSINNIYKIIKQSKAA